MASPPADLIQLARFLFGTAARQWWAAWALELVAGVISVAVGLVEVSENAALVGAAAVGALMLLAYVTRLKAEDNYGTAETMRRQSVFSEGIGWRIAGWQRRRWVQKAGAKRLEKLGIVPRDADYFATGAEIGPRRLAEMTSESAFYTRTQYVKVRLWMAVASIVVVVATVVLLGLSISREVPSSNGLFIATAVFLAVPVLTGMDMFGWWLKLGTLAQGIEEVERDLEEARAASNEADVVRLVSEYNCIVISGIPVTDWMFNRWRDEVARLWKEEQAASV
jgi:hypothetical protein